MCVYIYTYRISHIVHMHIYIYIHICTVYVYIYIYRDYTYLKHTTISEQIQRFIWGWGTSPCTNIRTAGIYGCSSPKKWKTWYLQVLQILIHSHKVGSGWVFWKPSHNCILESDIERRVPSTLLQKGFPSLHTSQCHIKFIVSLQWN